MTWNRSLRFTLSLSVKISQAEKKVASGVVPDSWAYANSTQMAHLEPESPSSRKVWAETKD